MADTLDNGPKVWLGLTQRQLDDAYSQAVYAPNIEVILARYATNSALARANLGAPRRLSYGATPVEEFDLFPAAPAAAPIVIFVHGGAWRGGSAAQYAFLAENFVRAGAHFIALDFASVLDTDGDLMVLARQVRTAIAVVHARAAEIGGDPERMYLLGHSSGAHLASVALVADWRAQGLPAGIVKGAVLAGGLYDMKPVRLSARSKYVAFTDESEDALSAIRHVDRWFAPAALLCGDKETPEFRRQTRDFHAALKASGNAASLTLAEHYNHFELLETLASPYGIAGRTALQLFELG